jgi:hypothetical protein
MSTQTLVKAVGIIKQKFNTKRNTGTGNWKAKTDFVLLFPDNTEKTFTIFDVLNTDLMRGQSVEFDYAVNGKYNTVQGTIHEVGGPQPSAPTATQAIAGTLQGTPATQAAPVQETEPVPAKRTYTRKTSTAQTTDAPEVSGREACRGEAEASVKTNLESALALAKATGFGNAPLADIVALADMVGRTQTAIFMDSKKDQRMSSFRK